MGLMPRLVAGLAEQGISAPTPIQTRAIPAALEGRDLLGLAQTGTGKTVAFGLPLLQVLIGAGTTPAPKSARALILAPTRELAQQISTSLRGYARDTHLKFAIATGGTSINVQINALKRGADVLVATPGRLVDLLDRGAVRLGATRYLVLDEADQMLDLGFVHALRRIAAELPKERQTMMFSATMPKQMAELAATYLSDALRIEVSPPGRPAEKIAQSVHFVEQAKKSALLIEHLDTHRDDLAVVFARTKHGAERLMKALDGAGFAAGSIHGNKSQSQRNRALKAFREGEMRVLVATDVAARGLDIPDVRYVYNYDLPNVPENYIHRIGRTARAGAEGSAVAYCSPDEVAALRAIQKQLGTEIPVHGGAEPVYSQPQAKKAPGKPRRRRRRGSQMRRAA